MDLNIYSPEFDQQITLRQAFEVFREFLDQFNSRSPQETDLLASWLELNAKGSTVDPAQLHDFLGSVRAVLARDA